MANARGKSSSGKKSGAKTTAKSSGKSQTKKKTGSSTKKSKSGGKSAAQLHRSNQLFAVVLFALGVLLTLFALFNGPVLWGAVHQILRGICGPMSYAVGPVCIVVSLMIAIERDHAEVHMRVWELTAFFVLLCGLTQYFFGYPYGDSFFQRILYLYLDGTELHSGGLLAMVTGWPLMKVLGGTGGLIVHILLLFILIMAVTGMTLLELLSGFTRPVKQLRENYAEREELRRERMAERAELEESTPPKSRRREAKSSFNIDVAISEEEKAAAEQERKDYIARKTADAKAKKESSAQDLDEALQKMQENGQSTRPPKLKKEPVAQPEPDTTPDASNLDAIIAAFKKKPEPAAPTDKPAEEAEIVVENPAEAAAPAAEAEPSVKLTSENPAGVGEAIGEILSDQPDLPEPPAPEGLEERMGEAFSAIRKEESAPKAPAVPVDLPFEPDSQPGEAAETVAASAPDPVPAEKTNIPAAAEVPAPPPYRLPPVSLLKLPHNPHSEDVSEELKQNASKLVETLKSFGVQTRIVDITRGPTVTRYELQPSTGVKISKITGLADDIALNLATAGVRIEAPIPNKPAVGIEVPNRVTDTVTIREVIDSDEFRNAKGALPAAFGRDIAGQITIGDIAAMPHMLIAGTTGSGKSVCVNSIIISLLYRFAPKDLRLIMVDPKMVEMVIYNGIPHLLVPVVTDARKASGALGWAVNEMLKRYATFSEHAVRDIRGYNKLVEKQAAGEQQEGLEPLEHMPYIVVVIDELSDLMMAAPNEVEDAICRIAQMGRAAGINLIVATQRPSVDVVTGLIKANIPSRIALTVSSQIDSRTIIDTGGAEKLLGHGDMLYAPVGKKPLRVQGCFVSDEEVESVVQFIKDNQTEAVQYDQKIIEDMEQRAAAETKGKGGKGGGDVSDGDSDPLIMEAVDVVLDAGQASTSYLQRRLKVGYARAARLMDELEDRGIVGPQDGSKPRELLITRSQWAEIKDRMENP